ncbi:hypothetical protein PR202_ga09929 [Eleusine coracana subsp. coracana]|uniref:DUF6598 domain-containing protein n=1 Tax=Eleusine coracana subsp. coracana TaxID=191504 RepID=A0AAV5C554_ELECO|nr:hypothetical protein PR202_ga09929 [Eleusine coracana subsp. coracana]
MEYMGEDDVVLLDSKDLKVNFTSDGHVLLSRNVVLVEEGAKLILGVKAWQNGGAHSAVEDKAEFPARVHSRSDGLLDVGFCKILLLLPGQYFARWCFRSVLGCIVADWVVFQLAYCMRSLSLMCTKNPAEHHVRP